MRGRWTGRGPECVVGHTVGTDPFMVQETHQRVSGTEVGIPTWLKRLPRGLRTEVLVVGRKGRILTVGGVGWGCREPSGERTVEGSRTPRVSAGVCRLEEQDEFSEEAEGSLETDLRVDERCRGSGTSGRGRGRGVRHTRVGRTEGVRTHRQDVKEDGPMGRDEGRRLRGQAGGTETREKETRGFRGPSGRYQGVDVVGQGPEETRPSRGVSSDSTLRAESGLNVISREMCHDSRSSPRG